MNKNLNPWMITTIFLVGIMIGFGTAKVLPGNQNPSAEARTIIAENPSQNDPTAGNQPTAPAALQVSHLDYGSAAKEKNKEGNWTLGSKDAKVVIEEFSDFQCPFCHQYFSQTFPEIIKNYINSGKVYYVYYNYPLSFHPQAPFAATAALCAGEQDKFWEMHGALFENQDAWSPQSTGNTKTFEDLATILKMDTAKFKECLGSEKYTAQIKKDTAVGEKNGISGTPSFMINGTKVVGAQPYSVIQQAIEEALKK